MLVRTASKNHKHSVNNPYSQFRDGWTVEQVLAAPQITKQLTKFMCSPTSVRAIHSFRRHLRTCFHTGRLGVLHHRIGGLRPQAPLGKPSDRSRGERADDRRPVHVREQEPHGCRRLHDDQELCRRGLYPGLIQERRRPRPSRRRRASRLLRRKRGQSTDRFHCE